jgi:hypothetical protein
MTMPVYLIVYIRGIHNGFTVDFDNHALAEKAIGDIISRGYFRTQEFPNLVSYYPLNSIDAMGIHTRGA